jgi:hypothetical protein
MPPSNIATAADYADAMMIARRAKTALVLFLLLMLLVQTIIFFVARMTDYVPIVGATPSLASSVSTATTAPAATQPSAAHDLVVPLLRYLTALIDFLGIALAIVLAVVLLLITKIMLVGRLIGVAQVTSAFVWCVVLVVLLFPWQAFLQNEDFKGDFKIPGVLYTWPELTHPTMGAKFNLDPNPKLEPTQTFLRWARFVGFPAASLVILLMVQAKSSRGVRAALGESELESPGDIRVS